MCKNKQTKKPVKAKGSLNANYIHSLKGDLTLGNKGKWDGSVGRKVWPQKPTNLNFISEPMERKENKTNSTVPSSDRHMQF